MAHVSENKKKLVKEYEDLISQYPIVGAVNIEGLPAKQFQTMREKLRGTVKLVVGKRRLFKIALENQKRKKKGLENLEQHLKGMPALLLSNENPFKLYSILKKNKSKAPAKAGQTAPGDIIVPKGPTGFAPGPVIGELGSAGIKAGIDAGKVVIKEDSLVCREGEVISEKLAGLLQRLNINPMEVGLDLTAVYENEDILLKSVLNIDEEEYLNNFISAAQESFNLAIFASYPTKDTIQLLLSKAAGDSMGLARSQDILTSDTVNEVLGKAERQMLGLKGKLKL